MPIQRIGGWTESSGLSYWLSRPLFWEVLSVAYEIESNDFVQTHGAFTFMKPFEKELDLVDVSTDG